MGYKMLATDLDGTLIPYGQNNQQPTAFNHELAMQWKQRGITKLCIATNQGGMVFSNGENKYPTPQIVAWRIAYAIDELSKHGITVKTVIASVYHPKATIKMIGDAMLGLAQEFAALAMFGKFNVGKVELRTKGTEFYRKPNPQMLFDLKATEYWGDSPEDADAARNANVRFFSVDRF